MFTTNIRSFCKICSRLLAQHTPMFSNASRDIVDHRDDDCNDRMNTNMPMLACVGKILYDDKMSTQYFLECTINIAIKNNNWNTLQEALSDSEISLLHVLLRCIWAGWEEGFNNIKSLDKIPPNDISTCFVVAIEESMIHSKRENFDNCINLFKSQDAEIKRKVMVDIERDIKSKNAKPCFGIEQLIGSCKETESINDDDEDDDSPDGCGVKGSGHKNSPSNASNNSQSTDDSDGNSKDNPNQSNQGGGQGRKHTVVPEIYTTENITYYSIKSSNVSVYEIESKEMSITNPLGCIGCLDMGTKSITEVVL